MGSEATIHYRKNIKAEKYNYLTTKEKDVVSSKVATFIKELLTTRGTCAFDRSYGTTFIEDIADIANKEKVAYFFDKNAKQLFLKYGIEAASAEQIVYNTPSTTLNVRIYVELADVAVDADFEHLYSGNFITSELLEI